VEDLGSTGGADALGAMVVLDGHRDAEQGPGLTLRPPRVGGGRRGQSLFLGHGQESLDLGFDGLQPRQDGFRQFDGRDGLGFQLLGRFMQRQFVKFHTFTFGAKRLQVAQESNILTLGTKRQSPFVFSQFISSSSP
jgi:hypothetical protein